MAALPPSEPVVFDTFTGIFQPSVGAGGPPVLMLSPIGYEELCSRAFFASLADRLAARGIASLRFDYPGTADALDGEPDGLDDWRSAAAAAADRLRQLTGRRSLAVLGQGLGAALGPAWSADLGPVDAMVLLEPPASGRAYLRGLKAWGAVIAAGLGLAPDPTEAESLSVAGMALPAGRVAAIRALDPARLARVPAASVLLLCRPGGGARALVDRLQGQAVALTQAEFTGYDDLLTDPTSARIPDAAIGTITDWFAGQAGEQAAGPMRAAPRPPCCDLQGDGFVERPIRFGPDGRLVGVVCRPAAAGQPRRAVILVNAGRDYRIGWGRSTVLQARALARSGIASLRYDASGIGDSRAPDGPQAELLYSRQQCDDLRAAVDTMEVRGHASVGLVGRCSGAWASFTVALDDPRVEELALINTGYFIWDPTQKLADVIRFSQRSVGDLGATFLKRAGLRRLLAGELDIRGAARFLGRQVNLQVVRRCAFLLGRLTPESRRYHELHRLFAGLDRRGVRTRLIYSEGDASLGELRSFMGPRLGRLPRYPTVSCREIAGADHNFTHQAARDELRDDLVQFFTAKLQQTATTHTPVQVDTPQIRIAVEA